LYGWNSADEVRGSLDGRATAAGDTDARGSAELHRYDRNAGNGSSDVTGGGGATSGCSAAALDNVGWEAGVLATAAAAAAAARPTGNGNWAARCGAAGGGNP